MRVQKAICPYCDGAKSFIRDAVDQYGEHTTYDEVCDLCDGNGEVSEKTFADVPPYFRCRDCDGEGTVSLSLNPYAPSAPCHWCNATGLDEEGRELQEEFYKRTEKAVA